MTGTTTNTPTTDVLRAAAALVSDFASGDSTAYFSHFDPDATFVFYTHPERLETRAAYEDLWSSWREEDDFAVLACASRNGIAQVNGETAVFIHDVETRVSTRSGGEKTLHERETIVFAQRDSGWVAIHEHLSPVAS
ncbi:MULTISPECIES: nuclear transport factor 2 family protein [Dermacoccus]|uniref:nuclear transport factor 2 family protein n=1 Tax=Dermacoccus TaxID=57495 RepID=UPI000938F613|nr:MULTISPECIES: nuclear transport factor 2 family protein [Dermacoccus]MBO1758587.1 nuclear transport factor 2 family protein [Dermacoccus sp. NHGro5]